jgi:hypothetical protein
MNKKAKRRDTKKGIRRGRHNEQKIAFTNVLKHFLIRPHNFLHLLFSHFALLFQWIRPRNFFESRKWYPGIKPPNFFMPCSHVSMPSFPSSKSHPLTLGDQVLKFFGIFSPRYYAASPVATSRMHPSFLRHRFTHLPFLPRRIRPVVIPVTSSRGR